MTTEEQLKFVTNTGERLLTELRQLRRENERLRAVAEAAKEVVAYDEPMSADIENLRYRLAELEGQ